MSSKNNWKRCDDCDIQTKNIRVFKGGFYCHNCYQKHITLIPTEGINQIFNEPLTNNIQVYFLLTNTQTKLLLKRLQFIFGKNKTKFKGIGSYVRGLVLGDLGLFEQNLKNGTIRQKI